MSASLRPTHDWRNASFAFVLLATWLFFSVATPVNAAPASWLEKWLGVSVTIGSAPLCLNAVHAPLEDGLHPVLLEDAQWRLATGTAPVFEILSLSNAKPWGNLALTVDASRWPASVPAALLEITIGRPDSSYQLVQFDGNGPAGAMGKACPLGFVEIEPVASETERWWTAWAVLASPRFAKRQQGGSDLRVFSSKSTFVRRIAVYPILADWRPLCQRIAGRIFQRVLGRMPNVHEWQRATEALSNGDLDPGILMTRLALSAEYIGRVRRGQRAEAMVKHLYWAFHDQTLTDRGVTTTAGLWRRKGPDEAIRSLVRLDRLSRMDWIADIED